MKEITKDRREPYIACRENVAIGSTIKVGIGKKTLPMKTTTCRTDNRVEATANGKKYLCFWNYGGWSAKQI